MRNVEGPDLGSISIHALREEGDCLRVDAVNPRGPFLSTPSVRRATLPRSVIERQLRISIHALREEGDLLTGIESA